MHALDGKTPYEMLHGKKPNLKGLPVWGTKVLVHDPSGGKLDMCAHEGRWIGFDAETGAHRVYFTDHHSIAVERNISFQRQSEDGPALKPTLPIEEESRTIEAEDNQQAPLTPTPAKTHQPTPKPQNDPLGPNFEVSSTGLRCSTRQRTESPYMHMLRSSVGTHSGRSGDTLLPRGM
jgi:hypothetical protein